MNDSRHTQPPERPSKRILKNMEQVMLGRTRSLPSLFLFFGLLFIDQFSKYFIAQIFPHWIVCNASGPWGLAIPLPILIVFAIGILAWMISIQWKQKHLHASFLLIIAGGTGNLLDRIWGGCVIDFISALNFPLFNSADIFLSLGCFLILWSWFHRWIHKTND